MQPEVKTIKRFPFDRIMAETEAKNAERLFALHLSRCDSAESAETLGGIFISLGEKFDKKKLALREKLD